MSTTALPNEKELLSLVALGSESAYKCFFRHYWDSIYSVALMFTKSVELSQDLAQDIFAQIWVKRERLTEVTDFSAYLYIVARNLIFDRLRRKVLVSSCAPHLIEHFSDPSLPPGSLLELKEMEELIFSGLRLLPPQQQQAFRLSRLQGLRHREIAQRMNISQQSVKSYIVRALSHLRRHVGARIAQTLLLSWLAGFYVA